VLAQGDCGSRRGGGSNEANAPRLTASPPDVAESGFPCAHEEDAERIGKIEFYMIARTKQSHRTNANCAWRWQFVDDCSDCFLYLSTKVEFQRSTSDSQIKASEAGRLSQI
jgi:hypothetical protein